MLRDVSSVCSKWEQCGDDVNDVENAVVRAALLEEDASDSDNDDAYVSGDAVSPNNVNAEAQEEDDEQLFWSNEGSC